MTARALSLPDQAAHLVAARDLVERAMRELEPLELAHGAVGLLDMARAELAGLHAHIRDATGTQHPELFAGRRR